MSIVALDRLGHAHGALVAALDGQDVDQIDEATRQLASALDEVKAAGAWLDRHAVTGRIREMLPLLQAARERVNFLTDITRRRVDLLARAGGRAAAATYSR